MSSGEEQAPISVFYSYSHKDEDLRRKLEDHLASLRRSGMISERYDRDIDAGEEWEREINRHLSSADIILLLVSPDFIASDYCWSGELRKALERHERGEARVIPVILRPCRWTATPLGKLQALPADGKPVTFWADQDAAFDDVVSAIARMVELLRKQRVRKPAVRTPFDDMAEGAARPAYEYEELFRAACRQLDSLPPALASAIMARRDHRRQEQPRLSAPIPKASPEILYHLSYSTLSRMLVYAAIGALIASVLGAGYAFLNGAETLPFLNTTRRATPKGGRGDPEAYPAECSVFAPPGLPAGGTIMVQVFLHPPQLGDAAEEAARLFDTAAAPRGFTSLSLEPRKGARVGFQLQAPDLWVKR